MKNIIFLKLLIKELQDGKKKRQKSLNLKEKRRQKKKYVNEKEVASKNG